jgi:acid stress-induced BolA-like protein IbaG/YrbA
MDVEQVTTLVRAELVDCEVSVSGEGSHYDITVVGDIFDGLRPVKKQQVVYAALSKQIADGSIHAVNIKTYTPDEWRALIN